MTLFWGILIGLGVGLLVGFVVLAYALRNPWSR
jgi:hypothetical protein